MVRLLFDEPLSEKLCDVLADIYPDSLHVRVLGHGGATDATVWELGLTHGCLVVSKDEDFNRLAVLRGAPPKFLWIRRGIVPRAKSRSSCADATLRSSNLVNRAKQRFSS